MGFYSHSVELDAEPEDPSLSPVSTTSSTLAPALPIERRTSSTSSGRLSPVPPSEPMVRRSSATSSGRLSPVPPEPPQRRVSMASSGRLSPVPPSEPMSRRVSGGSEAGDKYGDVFTGRILTPPRRRPSSILGASEGTVVDVPMRSFQGGYYPQLLALYRHLGFTPKPSAYTFSFAELGQRAYFTYEGASGASIPSLPSGAWRSPLALTRALIELLLAGVCYVLFLALAFAIWHSLLPERLQKAPFGAVIDAAAEKIDKPLRLLPRTRLGGPFRRFVSRLVIPLFSAVGTMTVPDVLAAPAEPLLDYVHAGVGTAHYSLGAISSRDVAMALASPPDLRLRLGISVDSIRYSAGKLVLGLDGREETFDRVVLATEASASLKLLESLEFDMTLAGKGRDRGRIRRIQKIRKEVLRSVTYRESIVVTHTDAESVTPPGDGRMINLVLPPSSKGASVWPRAAYEKADGSNKGLEAPHFAPEAGYIMATHETRGVLQTTNPICPISASKVLGVARMERALPFNSDALLSLLTHQPVPSSSTPQTYHARANGSGSSPDPSPPSSLSKSTSLSRSNSAASTLSRTGSLKEKSAEEEEDLVHLVGSYAYPGIPLLEGCVGSARRVAREILGREPEVDWDAARGGIVGRAWRWRRRARVGGVL